MCAGLRFNKSLPAEPVNSFSLVRPDGGQADIDCITTAIAAEQSVVIPALPPTRVLDLLLLLDNAFTTTPALQQIPVFYLAHTSQKAVSATRTMLEWLSQDITVQDHPLDFKHVKIVTEY